MQSTKRRRTGGWFGAVFLTALMSVAMAQVQHRPPAVPLVTNDPFFSLWSMADKLTDAPVKHWSEAPQPMTGLVRIDGKVYRWMGVHPRQYFALPQIDPMEQKSLEVTPLHTRYTFVQDGVQLKVTFFTPLFPRDLDVMSRPVSYLSWGAVSTDGKSHQVQVMLDIDPQVAVNEATQPVIWGRMRAGNLSLLQVGTRDQAVLHQSGDRMRIDWGYFRLVVPDATGATTAMSYDSLAQFASDGTLPNVDVMEMPKSAEWRGHPVHLAVNIPLGQVSATQVERHVLLAYTEGYAIEYLGRKLHEYWQRNGMTDAEMLQKAEQDFPELDRRGVTLDNELMRDAERVGGPDYRYMVSLAFRQTIAAHKLVADVDGQPMLFSKENDSNGCIDTVDVTYPSAPFFLLFNPRLLEAQLEPLMRYAALPRWKFPFAPHDLGTYPLANGQVYGGGETREENQMPVEESGDLLLLIDALGHREGDWHFAKRYMPQLTVWAKYLEAKGMDPENQLSTDDFAGHLAHNANLSLKAIEALAAFADIARQTGDIATSDRYARLSKSMVPRWEEMAIAGEHYKLAFDQPGTWSQLYNLVWDNLLNLHLFPPTISKTEWTFYEKHMNRYGLPLDNRNTATKLDWEFWTGTLTRDPKQFAEITGRTATWLDSTPSRVPMTDYYDTVSGKQKAFQARSVVGGIFIKMLDNDLLAHKWNHD